jgi:hypothetical protein
MASRTTRLVHQKCVRAPFRGAGQYNYIATQIAYMQDTRQQKIQRGLYGGGNLPAPYAIDRTMEKDRQVPVIYQPWHPIVIGLFERFKDYDFVLARMARYIEERPYLFPYPPAEDRQRFMFKTRMRTAPGGYSLSSGDSIREYFSNLTLGGYAKIGKDGEGTTLYLANAFEPAVPMDLLGESYAAILGHYPDGTPLERKKHAMRSRNLPAMESPAVLHGLLQSDDGAVSFTACHKKERPVYTCHKGVVRQDWASRNQVGIMRQQIAWSVACEDLDHIVITRLCELARYDADMSARIKTVWDRRASEEVSEVSLLATQIERAEAQILRLDKLLTDPEVPLSAETERRYLTMLREAEADRDALVAKQVGQDRQRDPAEVVPNFYHVLSHLPVEYKCLSQEGRKRMARQVIEDIRLNALSSHLFLLHVTWQTGIAVCPDIALVWRGMSPNTGDDWTPEEDDIMRSLYPKGAQVELMQALPQRGWNRILERAQMLGMRRAISHAGPHPFNVYHRTMRYDDLEAAASLVDDPAQQEFLREQIDALARQTVRGGLSAHWLLSLDRVSYASDAEPDDDPALLYVSAVASGSRRRGGSLHR